MSALKILIELLFFLIVFSFMVFVLKFECFYIIPNLDPESNYLDWLSGRFSNGNFSLFLLHYMQIF